MPVRSVNFREDQLDALDTLDVNRSQLVRQLLDAWLDLNDPIEAAFTREIELARRERADLRHDIARREARLEDTTEAIADLRSDLERVQREREQAVDDLLEWYDHHERKGLIRTDGYLAERAAEVGLTEETFLAMYEESRQ